MKREKSNKSKPEYIPRNNLWVMRKRQHISQKQLANILGHKTTSLIYRWEKGSITPDLNNALKLSIALSSPLEHLFHEHYTFLKSQIVPRKADQSTDK
ncbi:hypothetical protein COB64_03860 [Candidatus Wolfebacteria bacterium]|nr:MAG: hypothetical protein COB64_03860 [Candidatus Wolfebacteria bacterium]